MHGTIAPAGTDCPAPDVLARLRIHLCYAWRHRRLANIDAPRRFTELVQVRKLEDRSPTHPLLMDKVASKSLASARLGPEWTIPTLWTGHCLPERVPFPCPAILKARHGCNQNAALLVPPTRSEWERLRGVSRRWIERPYGRWLDEWAYRSVPRGLLAEPFVGDAGVLPVDYKVYVFGGQATHVQVHLGRGGHHRWIIHDRHWRNLVPSGDVPLPPRSLAAMLEAAETLALGEEFLRVDFYEIGGRPLFGEFCLYPGSGLDPFAADWIDFELGALWLEAAAGLQSAPAPAVAPARAAAKRGDVVRR